MIKNKKIKWFTITMIITFIIVFRLNIVVNAATTHTRNKVSTSSITTTNSPFNGKDFGKLIRYNTTLKWKTVSGVNYIDMPATFKVNNNSYCVQKGTEYSNSEEEDLEEVGGKFRLNCNNGTDRKLAGTVNKKWGTGDVRGDGLAFVLGCFTDVEYYNNRSHYTGSVPENSNPIQMTVWQFAKQSTVKNGYYYDACAYQNYHKSADEGVSVSRGSNAGTTESGNYYIIGPFKMSSYVKSTDGAYTVGSATDTRKLQDSIDGAPTGTNGGWQGDEIGNRKGDILRATAIFSNGKRGAAKVTKEIDFEIPNSGETFQLKIPKSDLNDVDELVSIRFIYQIIHACGKGIYYNISGQDMILVNGGLKNERRNCTNNVNVPLKTDMAIYKYISEVKHADGTTVNYASDNSVSNKPGSRSSLNQTTKQNDAVKIENGDQVTYIVKVENNSRFATSLKVKENTLPTHYDNIQIKKWNGSSWSNNINNCDIKYNSSVSDKRITISANSTNEYKIIINVKNLISGTERNRVEFYRRNEKFL